VNLDAVRVEGLRDRRRDRSLSASQRGQ
jgi:hypothetical protein